MKPKTNLGLNGQRSETTCTTDIIYEWTEVCAGGTCGISEIHWTEVEYCYTTTDGDSGWNGDNYEGDNIEPLGDDPGIPFYEPEPIEDSEIWEESICETDAFKNNSCLSGVWAKFQQSNKAYKLVKKFIINKPQPIELCFDLVANFAPGMENVGGKTSSSEAGGVKVTFNQSNLAQYPELVVAQAMIHEVVHAEMFRKLIASGYQVSIEDFPGLFDYYSRFMPLLDENGVKHYPNGTPQHNLMAAHYITIMAEALAEYDNFIGTDDEYKAIAWLGLEKSIVWSALETSVKIQIKADQLSILTGRPVCN